MGTIFAQATASGKAGVSIVRISGPQVAQALAVFGVVAQEKDRKVVRLTDELGELIDIGFLLTFPEQNSFTGEKVAELHLHGSPAIMRKVLDLLGRNGFRLAEPGEFTRRALENGRMDLSQVEGLGDLIEAETEVQRKQALRVFKGGLGELVEGWRRDLIRAAALLEATIDFSDEDVPENVFPEVTELLQGLAAQLTIEIEGVQIRERVREGFEIGIVGPPNIGKSTLLNRLAGRKAAIVSELAGTTRDVIEVHMDLDGLPVTFLDTAGIRQTDDRLEDLGIEHGQTRAEDADIRIHLVEEVGATLMPVLDGDIVLLGKSDLHQGERAGVSGLTGDGVEELVKKIGARLSERVSGAGTSTHLRHAVALERGLLLIKDVLDRLKGESTENIDLLAEDLRLAISSLDSLVGRIDTESLLDEIFSRFCIGK